MTVKVTFDFNTADEAAAFLQSLGDESTGLAAAGTSEPAKRGRGRPPKATQEPAAAPPAAPAAAPAAPAAAAAAAPAPTPAPAAAPAAVPFKAVADPISELAEIDHPKAVAVLAQFGVKKASDLKPEQYAAVAKAATDALAAAKGAPSASLI